MARSDPDTASRRRFRETMHFGHPDRVPYFEEGIRTSVRRCWRKQGMPRGFNLQQHFPSDPRIEIEPELDPRPARWPTSRADLKAFRRALDPSDPKRLPRNWSRRVRSLQKGDCVRMLRVHRGLFLSMGVLAWNRFYELMTQLAYEPELVRAAMQIQGEFAAAVAERVLAEVDIDAAIFSEPIGGNHGPLISPAMYAEVVLESYAPLMQVLRRGGVDVIIFRTYANARILIPNVLAHGFNCLWACEVNIEAMDYRSLRAEFGKDLRLIGGIDLDALRFGKESIDREIKTKVPPLLQQGGYVPLADGRVREDVSFENYLYYRQLLHEITCPG
jgi:uroporphyrinogen decarboxylase